MHANKLNKRCTLEKYQLATDGCIVIMVYASYRLCF